MSRSFYLWILFLPLTGLAQYTISGKVLNLNDKKPVANASVFLNNATVGGATTENGDFILNVARPGQYDLIVSIVGFETFQETLIVNSNIILPDILILPKTIQLKEVVVKPNLDWERIYAAFKSFFIGTSEYAQDCKILNPDMLDLDFDPKTLTLTGKSHDFLEIQNNALGYKIKYLLTNFAEDGRTGLLDYEGAALFEELKGTPAQQSRWQKHRMDVYLGSSMHFLRSTLSGEDVSTEGFKGYLLIRKPNPDYKGGRDNKFLQAVVKIPLNVNEMVKLTDKKGLYALYSTDHLFIAYTKKHDGAGVSLQITNSLHMPNNPSTIVTFESPYAFFDSNGIINNPQNIIFEGAWGKSRMAELLPVDFEPVIRK